MKNEIKKSNLVPIFEQGFESLKFSKKWKESLSKGIHRLVGYMEVNHLEVYSESIGKDFVTQQCRQPSYLQRINGRVIFLLDSFIEGKKYTLLPPRVTYVFPGNIGACSQRFIREEEVSKRLSYQTVRTYTATLSHFSIAMDIRQVALQNLKRHDIEAFMSSVQNMGAHIFIPLRKFLRYLHDTGITEQDFSQLLQNLKSRRGSKLPSVYTPEEIIQLERNIQRGSSIGKRNYAMLFMNKTIDFKSVLAPYLTAFVREHLMKGHKASSLQGRLRTFDNYLAEIKHINTYFMKSDYDKWRETISGHHPSTIYGEVSILARFLRYMCILGHECHIPRLPKKPVKDFVPYIYSKDEMVKIFDVADSLIMKRKYHKSIMMIPSSFY